MEQNKLSLKWGTVEFGVYLPSSFEQLEPSDNEIPRRFYSFWSFSEKSESPEFKTTYFGYYPNSISIYCRKCEPKENAFRITMHKDDFKEINYESKEENSFLYFQLHHPPSFYREDLEKNEEDTPRDKLIWIIAKDLKALIKEFPNDELLQDYFLRNLVIKVTGKDWKIPQDYNFKKITAELSVSLPPRLKYADLLQANMEFDIKFLVRVWLSHRKTTIFELSKKLLTKLEKLDQRIVKKTCLDIAKIPSNFYSKEKLSFEKLFDIIYEKNGLLKSLWENEEEYAGYFAPKSITITPNLIIYNVGLPVLSNAVFERYRREIWKVLRVKFREDSMQEVWKPLRDFGEERMGYLKCFRILDREYEFLAYSATQLRKGCAWMCLKEKEEFLAERIRKDIGDLSHIKIVPKYAARLGQLFSSSFGNIKINFQNVVKTIKEKKSPKKGTPFSEGIGKISQSLVNEIQSKYKIPGRVSAIQIRFGGEKGVLTVDPELKGDKICFRKSMEKWSISSFKDSLNLLNYSKYQPAYLVRQIIYLLCFLGIKDQVFLDIQQENIRDLLENNKENKDLIRYIRNDTPFALAAQLLKNCFDKGIETAKEPFLQGVTRVTAFGALLNVLGERGLGPFVKDGAVLFGVLDEYSILEEDEIYVCVSPSNGEDLNDIKIVEGDAIVTKTPCLYPGDLRKMKAVGKEKVGDRFNHIVNCIVFPAKGKRPVTNMISGSDLDGDTYFVSWDPRLIPKETVDAISYKVDDFPSEVRGDLWEKKEEVQIDDVLNHFKKFWREKTGHILNNYVRFIDRSLDKNDHKEEKRIDLLTKLKEMAQLFSLVVDYAKSGQAWNNETWGKQRTLEWPLHMIKSSESKYQQKKICPYNSKSAVAKLSNDLIQRKQIYSEKIEQRFSQGSAQINKEMIISGYKEYLPLAFNLLVLYYEETLAFMSFNGIKSEYEVFCGSFLGFVNGSRNCSKKIQDLEKLQENCMVHIKLIQHKSMTLIESELWKRKLRINDSEVRNKVASAVYIMTYYNAKCDIEEINSEIKEVKYRERFVSDSEKIPQLLGLPWYLFKDFMIEKLL